MYLYCYIFVVPALRLNWQIFRLRVRPERPQGLSSCAEQRGAEVIVRMPCG